MRVQIWSLPEFLFTLALTYEIKLVRSLLSLSTCPHNANFVMKGSGLEYVYWQWVALFWQTLVLFHLRGNVAWFAPMCKCDKMNFGVNVTAKHQQDMKISCHNGGMQNLNWGLICDSSVTYRSGMPKECNSSILFSFFILLLTSSSFLLASWLLTAWGSARFFISSHVSCVWHRPSSSAREAPANTVYFYDHMAIVETLLWNADVLTMCALYSLWDKDPSLGVRCYSHIALKAAHNYGSGSHYTTNHPLCRVLHSVQALPDTVNAFCRSGSCVFDVAPYSCCLSQSFTLKPFESCLKIGMLRNCFLIPFRWLVFMCIS